MRWNTLEYASLKWFLVTTLVVIACAVFYVRTAIPEYFTPSDFAVYYAPARAWIIGDNPYDRTVAHKTWVNAGGKSDIMPPGFRADYAEPWMPILQFPTAITAFAPLGFLSATNAVTLWYLLSFALLIIQTAALSSLAGTSLLRPTGLFLFAMTLLLAPVHEMFGYAQPSGPVISLIIVGVWAATYQKDFVAGLMIGLASAVKPQLGLAFFMYYLLRGRWYLVGTSVILNAVIAAIAILPMEMRGISWISGWLENLSMAESPGGMNSTSIENDGRIYMLQLQVIIHVLLEDSRIVNLIALLVVGVFATIFAWRRHQTPQKDELLSLGVVSFLSLLPVYHRFYDAALLVVPLAWAIAYPKRKPQFAWPMFLIVMTFLIPIAGVPRFEQILGFSPYELSTWWWHLFIEPFRTWILICGLILSIIAIGGRKSAQMDNKAQTI